MWPVAGDGGGVLDQQQADFMVVKWTCWAAPNATQHDGSAALSSAGMTQFANTKKIYVMRVQNGKQEKLPVNYRKLVKGEQMEQNYLLQPGDTIVVP